MRAPSSYTNPSVWLLYPLGYEQVSIHVEHPAYFAYVIRHLDEDGDGMISSDEMNNALV